MQGHYLFHQVMERVGPDLAIAIELAGGHFGPRGLALLFVLVIAPARVDRRVLVHIGEVAVGLCSTPCSPMCLDGLKASATGSGRCTKSGISSSKSKGAVAATPATGRLRDASTSMLEG